MKRTTKLIKSVAVITAVIIAVLSISACTGGKDGNLAGPDVEHSIVYFSKTSDETSRLLVDSKLLEDYIAGGIDAYQTVDGTVAIVRAGTGLYRVDSENIKKIYPAAVDRAVLSLDNEYILFSTATNVFVYDNKTNNVTKIEGLEADKITSLVISPSAKAFAFSAVKDDVCTAYKYIDGQLSVIFEAACMVAISDDGSFGYYVESIGRELTKKLYRFDGDETKLVSEFAEANFEINRDLSEITFDIDAKTHYSVSGSKAKKLVDASVITTAGEQSSVMGGEYCTVKLKNAESIFSCIYYTVYTAQNADSEKITKYDVYYVNASHKATKLVGGAERFSRGNDGTTIACLVNDNLCKVSAFNPQKPTLIASQVYTYTCDNDLENFYAVDMYATLYYIKSGTNPKELLRNAYFVVMTKSGVCLCISDYEDNSGTLKWAVGEDIGEVAKGVYSVEALAGTTVYYCNPGEKEGVFDVYVSDDSLNFELVIEQAQLVKK